MRKKLMKIYDMMYSHFGPRHWWPAETDFEVVVGAILTQFVSWKNVETAIANLKNEGILSAEGICKTDDEKLEELIRCTRFYKQKRKKLKAFCLHIMNNYNGELKRFFDKEIAELRKELLSLWGIGEETADSIILYAAHKPIFVVDAYTRRIFSRLGIFHYGIIYKDMQDFFMKHLPHDTQLFNEYHALIDGVGNHYCSDKKPLCDKCPLKNICKKT